jgi:hypothetical protein
MTTWIFLEQIGSVNSLNEWHKLGKDFRFDAEGNCWNIKCILEVSSSNPGWYNLLTFIVILNDKIQATGDSIRRPLNSSHSMLNLSEVCDRIYDYDTRNWKRLGPSSLSMYIFNISIHQNKQKNFSALLCNLMTFRSSETEEFWKSTAKSNTLQQWFLTEVQELSEIYSVEY